LGGRLLKSWLLTPVLNAGAREKRLDAVEVLTKDVVGHDRLVRRLGEIHDVERLVSRVTLGTASPRDVLALRDSLCAVPAIRSSLESCGAATLQQIRSKLDDLPDVVQLIQNAIAEDPPASSLDPGIIRSGFSAELDELRAIRRSGKTYIASLEARERERTGIQSLKVRFNQVFGYFIEVTRPNLPQVPSDYVRKQTLVNCERFVTEELQEYEEKVLRAEERIAELEKELFAQVRKTIAGEAGGIQATARTLGGLDATPSLGEVTAQHKYVRPQLSGSEEIYTHQRTQ